MKVAKWGNSLAVRIPRVVAEAMDLKEGDDLNIRIADKADLEVAKAPDFAEWLESMRKYEGRLPPDFKFDRLEANRRG